MLPQTRPLVSGARLHASTSAVIRSLFFPANEPVKCPVVARARRSSASNEAVDGAEPEAPKKRGRRPKTTAIENPEQPPYAEPAPTAAEVPEQPPDAEPAPAVAAKKSKRGRKTKAELQQIDAEVQQQLFGAASKQTQDLQDKYITDEEDDYMPVAPLAPAEGPGSWAAAAVGPGEDDRRRFPYHRKINQAAKDGNVSGAESAFSSMSAAGLAPGPRAYHVLLCAYLKAKDLPGGLSVTTRATEAGVQLLPESYAALILAHMDLSPPDVTVAKALYGAVAGTNTNAQLPWGVLSRLLAAKGCAQDAVDIVREGLSAGLQLDVDIAEAYIKALCDIQQSDAALKVLDTLTARYGFRPEARHVNYVVVAEALSGNIVDAAGLVDAAGARGWGRNAGSFNGLLAGYVMMLKQEQKPTDKLINDFTMTRSRMIQSGVRPDKFTFKLEAEGYVVLRDARSAMAALKSMRNTAGAMGCRLLDPAALAGLLQLLCDQDMPVDLLQLLVYMSEDGCRLPQGALAADADGRTLLSRWVVGHMEGMATRAEAKEASDVMLAGEVEYINGVAIGPGRCVVDDDGLVVPVSKCTVKELRAEAEARGVPDVDSMKRPDLTAVVKAARARLPFNVLKAQVSTGDGARAGKKAPKAAAASKKRKGPRNYYRELWAVDERHEVEAAQATRGLVGAEKFILAGEALDDIDVTDDQYGIASLKAIKDVNFEAVMEAKMLDEGTAAIMNVGDEDVTSGFATLLPGLGEDDEEDDADEDEGSKAGSNGDMDDAAWRKMDSFEARGRDGQTLQEGYAQLQLLEARQIDTDEANLVAGMDVALDCVRAAEILGGSITAADVLTLAAAAQAERSPTAAAAVAGRLFILLQPGVVDPATGAPYSADFVLQQYEQLADLCLRFRAPQAADAVLEAAEAQKLRPSEGIMNRLTVALRGKPRRSERLALESADLLDRAGVDTAADDELLLQQQQQQQQQQLPEAGPVTDIAALSTVDQPLLGAPGQQQEATAAAAGSSTDEADIEEIPLSDEMKEIGNLLVGIKTMQERREFFGNALVDGAGLTVEAAQEVLDQPEALMLDMHWLPVEMLTPEDGSAYDEAEQEGEEGQEKQQTWTLLQLAHAAASDSLSPEQQEWLLGEAERHNLPLMLDEDTGKLVWPGTPEYEAWAEYSPEEHDQDWEAMREAFMECFADEINTAEEAAQLLTKQTEDEDGNWKQPEPEELEKLEAMQESFFEYLTNSGIYKFGEVEEIEEGEKVPTATINPSGLDNLDFDKQLQALAEQFGPVIEAQRKQLNLEKLEEMGVPVKEFKLDVPRAGASSSTTLAAGKE